MKTINLVVEYWDPKKHRVFYGPYLRKYWYLNRKQIKKSEPVVL